MNVAPSIPSWHAAPCMFSFACAVTPVTYKTQRTNHVCVFVCFLKPTEYSSLLSAFCFVLVYSDREGSDSEKDSLLSTATRTRMRTINMYRIRYLDDADSVRHVDSIAVRSQAHVRLLLPVGSARKKRFLKMRKGNGNN